MDGWSVVTMSMKALTIRHPSGKVQRSIALKEGCCYVDVAIHNSYAYLLHLLWRSAPGTVMVSVLDLESGALIKEIGLPDALDLDGFSSIQVHKGEELYLTDDQVGGVLVIDLNGAVKGIFKGIPRVRSMSFVEGPQHWLCIHDDQGWKGATWELASCDVVAHSAQFDFVAQLHLVDHLLASYPSSLVVDGTNVIVATNVELCLLDLQTMEKVWNVDMADVEREHAGCVALALGKFVVLHDPCPFGGKAKIRFYDLATGNLLRTLDVESSDEIQRSMALWVKK